MRTGPGRPERIKWNAPSFYYKEDLGAFNPRSSQFAHLILLFPGGGALPESSPILEGTHVNRREVKFFGMDDVKAKRWGASWKVMMDLLRRMHAAGIALVAGTDSTAGFGLQRELELYVQAGIPTAQALKIATWNGAKYSRTLDDAGSIVPGKRADLVLVDGDPTTDIADIRKLAKEMFDAKATAIRMGVALERHHGGGQTIRAVCCIAGLTGAWRYVGGGTMQFPLWEFPINFGVVCRPDYIQPGTRVINNLRLGQALTGEMPLDPPLIRAWGLLAKRRQQLQFACQDRHRGAELLLGVVACDEEAQARRLQAHGRVDDGLDIDALRQKTLGEQHAGIAVAHDQRGDGRAFIAPEGEPGFPRQGMEQARALAQLAQA